MFSATSKVGPPLNKKYFFNEVVADHIVGKVPGNKPCYPSQSGDSSNN